MKAVLASVLLVLPLLFNSCGSAAASAAGSYTLDTDAVVAEAQKEIDKLPADQKGMAEMMVNMLKGMKATLELNADNSFTGTMTTPMGESKIKGTYKVEGEKITVNQTHEDDKEKADTKTGTFKDGKISITEEQGGKPMTLVFKKK